MHHRRRRVHSHRRDRSRDWRYWNLRRLAGDHHVLRQLLRPLVEWARRVTNHKWCRYSSRYRRPTWSDFKSSCASPSATLSAIEMVIGQLRRVSTRFVLLLLFFRVSYGPRHAAPPEGPVCWWGALIVGQLRFRQSHCPYGFLRGGICV